MPAPADQDFEQEWGFRKFTLDRRAGVYLYPNLVNGAGDTVVVLEESKLCDWGQRRGRCTVGGRSHRSEASGYAGQMEGVD